MEERLHSLMSSKELHALSCQQSPLAAHASMQELRQQSCAGAAPGPQMLWAHCSTAQPVQSTRSAAVLGFALFLLLPISSCSCSWCCHHLLGLFSEAPCLSICSLMLSTSLLSAMISSCSHTVNVTPPALRKGSVYISGLFSAVLENSCDERRAWPGVVEVSNRTQPWLLEQLCPAFVFWECGCQAMLIRFVAMSVLGQKPAWHG